MLVILLLALMAESKAATVHATNITTLSPCEIIWDSTVRSALQILRRSKDEGVEILTSSALYPCLHDDGIDSRHLTLTLVGDKGGSPIEQTNQDRGFIHFWNPRVSNKDIMVAGVSDGHGVLGHYVSEWIRYQLKLLLVESLSEKGQISTDKIAETVITLDKSMPSVLGSSGGATLSFLVKQGDSLFFSNTGDSQSFLAAAILDDDNELLNVEVVFASELHKPNSTLERTRLESLGYTIDEEENRVWYTVEGGQQAMATSRSIGDHEAGQALIPDPDVTKVSVAMVLEDLAKMESQTGCAEVQADGSLDSTVCGDVHTTSLDKIHLFAVSATDGILDYIAPEAMAYQVSK